MTEQEIIEGNKLIAEFMGGKVEDTLRCSNYTKIGLPKWAFKCYDFDVLKISGFEYNSSWDWLMPVVEKIEKAGYCVSMYRDNCSVYNKNGERVGNGVHNKGKIICIITAVIEFINWYNIQNK